MNVLLLKAWLNDMGLPLIGSRLAAISQLDSRSLTLKLIADDGPHHLVLSVLEEYPVLAIVDKPEKMPSTSEAENNFTKALRFHLSGYQLDGISQEGFDRSVQFSFSTTDTYGQVTHKILRVELVGRASNAFLISERGMVISILKRVRQGQNRVRRIITGKPLPPPPPLGKLVAAESAPDDLADELAEIAQKEGVAAEGAIEHLFVKRVAGCDRKMWDRLEPLLPVEYDFDTLLAFIARLQKGEFSAELFGIGVDQATPNSIALEGWSKCRQRRFKKTRPPNLKRERLSARLDQLLSQRTLATRSDEVEQLGLELLKSGSSGEAPEKPREYLQQWKLEHVDWADQIRLDSTIADNGQELVHYAQRLRRSADKLDRMITGAEQELLKLDEKPAKAKKREADPVKSVQSRLEKQGVKYLRFVSSDGIHILCGVNDKSNDGLIRVFGSGRHLWLHARDYPGSHVIVLNGGRDVPRATLEEAAIVAGYYSQGRGEGDMEVSYLPMKHLRRPKNAKPGQVLKMKENVINVRPEKFEALKGKLRYEKE